jgi:hypothetical protein
MKVSTLVRSSLTAVVVALGSAARAAFEFTGYMTASGETRFVVTESDSNRVSGWLRLGQTFAGHVLVEFDSKDEVLVLKRDTEVIRLRLKDSRVHDGKTAVAERKLVEFHMSPTGKITVEGRDIPHEKLEELLRTLAAGGMPLSIVVREPESPTSAVHDAIGKISAALKQSGAKRWILKARQPGQPP